MVYTQIMSNTTKFSELASNLNIQTNGILGVLMIVSFFIVMFVNLKSYTTPKAFAVSSFITALFSILMNKAGIVPDSIVWLTIIASALGVLALYLES